VGAVSLLGFETQAASVREAARRMLATLPVASPDAAEQPRPVLWRILDVCRATPQREAVRDSAGRSLTFAALVAAAEAVRLALDQALAGRGDVSADAPVVCSFGSSVMYAFAVLGVALAGRPYVPLTPRLPPARVAALVARAGACVVLSEKALSGQHADPAWPAGVPTVLVDGMTEADDAGAVAAGVVQRETGGNMAAALARMAYIRFTSGSTGEPKGVRISAHSQAVYHALMDAAAIMDKDDVAVALAQVQTGRPALGVIALTCRPVVLRCQRARVLSAVAWRPCSDRLGRATPSAGRTDGLRGGARGHVPEHDAYRGTHGRGDGCPAAVQAVPRGRSAAARARAHGLRCRRALCVERLRADRSHGGHHATPVH
jgi:hypothetical protein